MGDNTGRGTEKLKRAGGGSELAGAPGSHGEGAAKEETMTNGDGGTDREDDADRERWKQ